MSVRDSLVHFASRLRSVCSRFLARPLFRRRKLDSRQHQQEEIKALQEEIDRLNLTMEARVLERTEEFRVKARQMALVEQAGRRFSSILDPEVLLQEAVHTIREEFGYYSVSLYLLSNELWILSSLSTGDDSIQQQPGFTVYVQPDMIDRLQQTGRPMAQGNLLEKAHPLGLPRLGRGRSSMTVPLIASDLLLGALDVQSPLSQYFNEGDALILHTVANRIAIALERGRLYRQEQRARQRADAMAVLARVVTTSLDLNRVLYLALDQLSLVLPYDAAAILLLEEGQLIPAASRNLSPEAGRSLVTMFASERRLGLADLLERGEPLLATILEDPGEAVLPELGAFSSWLAVPLTSRGTVIGAVLLASRKPGAYGETDLPTAEDFAWQLSTAIENARLYNRIRLERDRIGTLYETAQQLNANLEIEDLLRHILELAQTSVGAVTGSLILLDRTGKPTHCILSRPYEGLDGILNEILTDGAAGWAYREQRGQLIQDTFTDPRWYVLPDDPWATRSGIVVPLIGQGEVIGILTVVHPQVGHFDHDDLDLMTSIAGQASTVVQRAHLFATIREERARLETVIEGTADAVIVLDEEGKVLHINRSAADLFELDPTEVTGHSPVRLLEHPALWELLCQNEEVGNPTHTEVPLPDGKTFYATLTPIPDVGAVITMQDISYLKQLDRMKSEFVATVSHDLRTPLGAVQGFAEMLDVAGPLTEDQNDFVNRIIHTTEHMTGLVEDLLDLAKIEAGVEMDMAPCQIAAVIAEVVDQIARPAAMKQVSLEILVPEDLELVWGNGRRLGQVVGNLLDNAIKYTPKGGQVTLCAHCEDDELRVEVSDNGPGIAVTDLPRIFEKFYRPPHTAQHTSGSGLGLSIARSIVQAHGGRIWVESKEGEGATFSFCIPCWKT